MFEVSCEKIAKCDVDQKAYKGLPAGSYACAAVSAPFAADTLGKVLAARAKGAAAACEGKGKDLSCSLQSTGKGEKTSVSEGGLSEALSAMSAVQGVLLQAKGVGAVGNRNGGTPTASARVLAWPSGWGAGSRDSWACVLPCSR